ncbi:MAG: hypothetical protein RL557_570 [archaeon]|jgi:uncharacterized secreted protein with C-terminal beta-propeller domain
MTDDKFILMGIDDENSKDIAEILKSKTAKKILDYLGDVKEASEKDLADKLGIPINTVEYNLKKLIKAGLVVPSGNFFWSVKGKKIPMYKLAKKHIIIGTKKPNLNMLKTLLPVVAVIVGLIALLVFFQSYAPEKNVYDNDLKTFSSLSELKEFLKDNQGYGYYGSGGIRMFAEKTEASVASADSGAAPTAPSGEAGGTDYSATNVQVAGVDEADIVKNDGTYLYIVSNNKVFIVDAYPADEMNVISTISFNESTYISQLYLQNDKLVVFSNSYTYYDGCRGDVCILAQLKTASAGEGNAGAASVDSPPSDSAIAEKMIAPPYYYSQPSTYVEVYDISDRKNPSLKEKIELEGNYVDSRMIDGYVYVISNKYIDSNNPIPPVYSVNGVEEKIAVDSIYYFNYPQSNYVFTTVSALALDNGELTHKTYLTGSSTAVYVSEKNIYLTTVKQQDYNDYVTRFIDEVARPLLPASDVEKIMNSDEDEYMKQSRMQELIYQKSLSLKGDEKETFDAQLKTLTENFEMKMSKDYEKTVVHKISVDEDEINYETSGEVPGYVLNQFSMDEHKGYFRIATTTGNWRDISLNHLYVLDDDLTIVGKVEDLAKGERIYSVRFMGDKAYMVTFRQVDPLYVIDLSDEEDPTVLGYLKVTGFSNYLHPYDETHLIGVGMQATEEGRTQGLKIALFDVSDFENPKEMSVYDFTVRMPNMYSYSYSEALYDHKAFLFDKERELLVIPVSSSVYSHDYQFSSFWQGAYVFGINLEEGISERGKISHFEKENEWQYTVKRSLYIDDVLYTISDLKVKANELDDLKEVKEVVLKS